MIEPNKLKHGLSQKPKKKKHLFLRSAKHTITRPRQVSTKHAVILVVANVIFVVVIAFAAAAVVGA